MYAAHDIKSGSEAKPIRVLIVESQSELGALWQLHLERHKLEVHRASTQEEAIVCLRDTPVDIIVLNLVLQDGSALAVADYAQYSQPETRVIFVTNTTFFSDGSIFAHVGNARAFLPSDTPPEDLAAMIEHYVGEGR